MKRNRPSHPRPSGTTLGHHGWDRKTQRRARPQCSRWKAPKRRPGGSIQTAENFLAGKGILATLGAFRANRVFPCHQKPGTDGFVLPRFVPVPHGAVRKIHPRDIERYVEAVRLQTMHPEPNTIGFKNLLGEFSTSVRTEGTPRRIHRLPGKAAYPLCPGHSSRV